MKRRLIIWALTVNLVVALCFKIFSGGTGHPDDYEIANFSYVQQPDEITCGPTSTLMVIQRYGERPTLRQVESKTKTEWFTYDGHPIGMTSPEYVAEAMKQFGIKARRKTLNIDQLKHEVCQNKPVVVLLRSGFKLWHYVVVIGFTKSTIVTADPASGSREEMALSDFMGSWAFTTDMQGMPMCLPCGTCDGTGFWANRNLGPLAICQICNGTGRKPDYVATLLSSADIYPMTAIVPSRPAD
jgi:predicted double-glycine peptidase